MDTHLDPTSIALLNLLTEKQKDYALTLYANREKKASTRLHPMGGLWRVLFLPRTSGEEYPSLDPLRLLHRHYLVDHRPFPHLRHGEAEESGDPEDLYRGSPAALPEPRAARAF